MCHDGGEKVESTIRKYELMLMEEDKMINEYYFSKFFVTVNQNEILLLKR